MKKGIIVGKMERGYTDKNGQQKFARELYVVWDAPNQPRDGESGQKVESVFVRFPTIECIYLSYPISWAMVIAANTFFLIFYYKRLIRGQIS